MQSLALSLRPIWPFLTFLASGALLGAAHAFETFGGLAPCPLCLDQREWHWGVLAASAARRRDRAVLCEIRLGGGAAHWAGVLGSAAMAGYHVAVEQHWVIAQCDAPVRGRPSFRCRRPAGRAALRYAGVDLAWGLHGGLQRAYLVCADAGELRHRGCAEREPWVDITRRCPAKACERASWRR